MKIISFERTVPTPNTSLYLAGECEKVIKNDEYKTATEALIKSNPNANIVILHSINFKEAPTYPKECKILDYFDDYKKLFSTISDEILKDDKIIIDITHSMRDAAFMGFLLALLNRNKAKIEIIYAEQISEMGKPRVFEFKFLTEYVNIIDFFFVLKSFNEFVKIPYSDTDDLLYLKLKDFSESLLSNQILKCITKYPDLKNELISRQNSDLYFLKNEISEVLNDIEFFENISKKERYEAYYKISKFLYNKNYFLNTSNFLIEALHMYFFKYLKKYIISKNNLEPNYEVLQLCLNFINQGTLNDKNYEIKPPCDYFIELNSAVFMQLADFRRKIGKIRHKLSHISMEENISPKNGLKILLGDFENLVLKEDILSNLVEIVDEERVKGFTSYHLEKFATQVRNKTLTKNIKTDTVKKKLLEFYDNNLPKTDECYDLFKTNNKSKILALNLKNKELYFNPNLKE